MSKRKSFDMNDTESDYDFIARLKTLADEHEKPKKLPSLKDFLNKKDVYGNLHKLKVQRPEISWAEITVVLNEKYGTHFKPSTVSSIFCALEKERGESRKSQFSKKAKKTQAQQDASQSSNQIQNGVINDLTNK